MGIGGFGSSDFTIGAGPRDYGVKPGYESSPAECQTCKTRKYQDGSDENVSFKSASHISPSQAGAAVRAHEGEHVTNAYLKAAEEGGKVLSVGVSIHSAICPECGRVYVSGGLTRSVIATPKDGGDGNDGNDPTGQGQSKNPYAQNKQSLFGMMNTGIRADFTV